MIEGTAYQLGTLNGIITVGGLWIVVVLLAFIFAPIAVPHVT